MRLLVLLLAGWLAAGAVLRGDEQLVEEFDGHASLTTSDFKVSDGWEIRWHSEQVLSVGVIRLDNTVVAGATGHDIGSLFVPQGGTFRIRVRGMDPIPWDVKVYTLGPVQPEDDHGEITFYEPTPGPDYKPPPPTPPVPVKKAAEPVIAPAPPPVPTALDTNQLLSVVTVKGDRKQGAGFFLKTGTGTVVITTLGLLSDNPNLQLSTVNGGKLTVTKIQGATDRDVAMISVKDFGFPAFNPGDPTVIKPGDTILTLSTDGTPAPAAPVTSIDSGHIEVASLQALTGAPVVLARTGEVIGVVGASAPSISIEKFKSETFADREAEEAAAGLPYILRFDNVSGFETYAGDRLQNQTLFLDNFHEQSRDLDSYLNSSEDEKSKLWQRNDKIVAANSAFLMATPSGGDPAERLEALRSLLFQLGLAADTDMDQIGVRANFSSYENRRAQDEKAYRAALKAELDKYNDNLHHFNHVVLRNN